MGRTVSSRRIVLQAAAMMCLFIPSPGRAETPPLTLPQVVEYALNHNGALKSLRDEKGVRDAGKIRAGQLPNPTLEFQGATGALTASPAESNLSLGISQEFLMAGKREKRLALAERELEWYRWQLADRERLLREEVQIAFYDTLLALKRVELGKRAVELSRQLLSVAKERVAAGDIPEFEMDLPKVEVARRKGARIDFGNALVRSQARLFSLMGAPRGESHPITGELDAKTPLAPPLPDLKQTAAAHRPDLKSLEAERSRGEADVTLARAEGVPNITAGISLKRDTTSIEVGGVEGRDTAYTIGAAISVPLPLFSRNEAGVKEARARQSSAESRLAAARDAVEREVETAYDGYLNSAKVLALYQADILPQIEENLELMQEAYRLGEVGILEIMQEQKKYLEASDGYLTALHERRLALVRLEAAVATELTGGGK